MSIVDSKMKPFIWSLFLFASSMTVFGMNPNVVEDCMQHLLFPNNRPNANDLLGRFPAIVEQIDRSRHHVIPLNVLLEFFNNVLIRDYTLSTSYLGRLNHYLTLIYDLVPWDVQDRILPPGGAIPVASEAYRDHLRQTNIIFRIIEANPETIRRLINRGRLTRNDVNRLVQLFFTWLPGNIFYGPRHRSDDPGPGFETNAAHIVGQQNFNVLYTVYEEMRNFNEHQHQMPQTARYAVIVRVFRDLNIILQRTRAYDYRPEQWVLGADGRYAINLNFPTDHNGDKRRKRSIKPTVERNHNLKKRENVIETPDINLDIDFDSFSEKDKTFQKCFDTLYNHINETVRNLSDNPFNGEGYYFKSHCDRDCSPGCRGLLNPPFDIVSRDKCYVSGTCSTYSGSLFKSLLWSLQCNCQNETPCY